MELLTDISDRFTFVEESLVYVDEPIDGFVVRRSDGARYAFRCRQIVARTVWHWTLLPAGESDVADEVFSAGIRRPPAHWLSVLEDRREEPHTVRLVEMTETVPPPICW